MQEQTVTFKRARWHRYNPSLGYSLARDQHQTPYPLGINLHYHPRGHHGRTKTQCRAGPLPALQGQDYEVIGVAPHSETEQPLVGYRCLYRGHSLGVRPLAMLRATVEVAGGRVPRFARVDAD